MLHVDSVRAIDLAEQALRLAAEADDALLLGIVYGALDVIGEKNADALALVDKALSNVSPAVEVKSRRVGGATYQVPVEVRPARRLALAMRWTIDAARKRGETSMPRKLAGELIDAAESRGGAVKKREETHRMAEANKAFSHYKF